MLSYGAYVAEVFRSGHRLDPPLAGQQRRGARALAAAQALRFVVVPQAVRRVVPPLLNDFVSLQKDTALVSRGGVSSTRCSPRATTATTTSTTRRYVVVALFFVVLTVPLARFTDWLQRRCARARAGGCAVSGSVSGPTRGEPLLEVRDLRKSYGDRRRARRHRPDRPAHDVVCLIGSSGSGKSTLLRCLEPARADRRRRDPLRRPRDLRPARRPARGAPADRDGLPGLQPLPAPHRPRQLHARAAPGARRTAGRGRGARPRPARPLRPRGRARDKHPDRLSGGQQQRVALVRALCTGPSCCCSTRSPPPSTPSWSATC